jgi:hypothetical protein
MLAGYEPKSQWLRNTYGKQGVRKLGANRHPWASRRWMPANKE